MAFNPQVPTTPDVRIPPVPQDSDAWSTPGFRHNQHGTPASQAAGGGSSPPPMSSLQFTPSPLPNSTPSIISPLFIDRLARDMKLEPGQAKSLHDFVEVRVLVYQFGAFC
jgi:hypothetical protein